MQGIESEQSIYIYLLANFMSIKAVFFLFCYELIISCNFIALPLNLVLILPSYASIKLYFFFELLCSKQCCRMKNWHTFEEFTIFLLADIGDLYICAWSPLMLCLSLFVYDCYSCDAVLNGRESEFNPIFVITCWTCMWNLINYKKTKHCIWR